jgi:hypothetical protein
MWKVIRTMTSVPTSPITANLSKDGKRLNCQICGTPLAEITRFIGSDTVMVKALHGWKLKATGIWEPNPRTKKQHLHDARLAANDPRPYRRWEASDRLYDGRSQRFNRGYDEGVRTADGATVQLPAGYAADKQCGIIWSNVEVLKGSAIQVPRLRVHQFGPLKAQDARVHCASCGAVNWVTAQSVAMPEGS